MWFRKTIPAPGLTEELTQAVWDVKGRLKQLETNMEAHLDELSKRYRRAEQSEKRFEDKKASGDCEDCEEERKVHPALKARMMRSERLNSGVK